MKRLLSNMAVKFGIGPILQGVTEGLDGLQIQVIRRLVQNLSH